MRAVAAAVLLAGGRAVAQGGVLDQSSPATNAGFDVSDPASVWQQQVRTGFSGTLEGVRLTFFGPAGAQTNVRIKVGPAWIPGPAAAAIVATKTTGSAQAIFLNFSAFNIQMAAGQPFVIEVQGNGTGMNLTGNLVLPPGTPLYPEPLYRNGAVHSSGGFRHGFQTYMIPGPGPCYPNCDGSQFQPILNMGDFSCFLAKFAAGDVGYANCDGSTRPPVLNVADFACFLNRFAQGCP